jgi:hypothetical protein
MPTRTASTSGGPSIRAGIWSLAAECIDVSARPIARHRRAVDSGIAALCAEAVGVMHALNSATLES